MAWDKRCMRQVQRGASSEQAALALAPPTLPPFPLLSQTYLQALPHRRNVLLVRHELLVVGVLGPVWVCKGSGTEWARLDRSYPTFAVVLCCLLGLRGGGGEEATKLAWPNLHVQQSQQTCAMLGKDRDVRGQGAKQGREHRRKSMTLDHTTSLHCSTVLAESLPAIQSSEWAC
jgi:hypothetical protein